MARTSLLSLVREEFERVYLLKELTEHGWNRTETARDLGISYRVLCYKIAQLGIRVESVSAAGS